MPGAVIAASCFSVLKETLGTEGLDDSSLQAFAFVEGEQWYTQNGSLNIFRMTQDMTEQVAGMYLDVMSGESEAESDESRHLFILTIGSNEFCKGMARFLMLNRKGGVEDEHRLRERLETAVVNSVTWTDTNKNELGTGDIVSMFGNARAAMREAWNN